MCPIAQYTNAFIYFVKKYVFLRKSSLLMNDQFNKVFYAY